MTAEPLRLDTAKSGEARVETRGRIVRAATVSEDVEPPPPAPARYGVTDASISTPLTKYVAVTAPDTGVLQLNVTCSAGAFLGVFFYIYGRVGHWDSFSASPRPSMTWRLDPDGSYAPPGGLITGGPRDNSTLQPTEAFWSGYFMIGGFTGTRSYTLIATPRARGAFPQTDTFNLYPEDITMSVGHFGAVTLSTSVVPTSNRLFFRRSSSFASTGAGLYRELVVPAGVTSMSVEMHGATGNPAGLTGSTLLAATVEGTLSTVPGETLRIYAGQRGGNGFSNNDPVGGWPDGGSGQIGPSFVGFNGNGGGGSSQIRVSPYGLSDRVVVAGGSGGFGTFPSTDSRQPGMGGWPDGTASPGGATGGGGGTQTAGGAAGTGGGAAVPATAGTFGQGGDGSIGPTDGGAGGGGGYYGGGGSYPSAGGGGGSSYYDSGRFSPSTLTTGGHFDDGSVTLTW